MSGAQRHQGRQVGQRVHLCCSATVGATTRAAWPRFWQPRRPRGLAQGNKGAISLPPLSGRPASASRLRVCVCVCVCVYVCVLLHAQQAYGDLDGLGLKSLRATAIYTCFSLGPRFLLFGQ